jgi:hypothetical protein
METIPTRNQTLESSQTTDLEIFRDQLIQTYRNGLTLAQKISMKLNEKKKFAPQICVINGLNPYVDPASQKVMKKLLGGFTGEQFPVDVYQKNGDQRRLVTWTQEHRSDADQTTGFKDPFASYYAFTQREIQVANVLSGEDISLEIFNKTLAQLHSCSMDTLVGYSTGALVLLSFLNSLAYIAYTDEHAPSMLPVNLQNRYHSLKTIGFDCGMFLEKICTHLKLIQLVRANVDANYFAELHPRLRQLLIDHEVQIINYYHPVDVVLLSAQAQQQIAKQNFFQPMGTQKISDPELLVINKKWGTWGRKSHSRVATEEEYIQQLLQDRDQYVFNTELDCKN